MATTYATYQFYTGTYLGTSIAQADFARLALMASVTIDLLTYDRAAAVVAADTDDDTIEKIGLATCAVADTLQKLEESGGAIQSESLGRHSVTYANPQTEDAAAYKAAKLYLWSTSLMYRGFTDDER